MSHQSEINENGPHFTVDMIIHSRWNKNGNVRNNFKNLSKQNLRTLQV